MNRISPLSQSPAFRRRMRGIKARAQNGAAGLAAQMEVVRQAGPLPLGESDLGRLASAGLLVVEPGHLHDVVHGSGGVGANQIPNGRRHVGVSVQQGSANPFLESGRDLGDRQIKTVRLVAGECVPLDRHGVLDRGEAGQLVDGGVDEFLGSRIGHALDLLRRLSIGPRVAGGRQ